MHTVSYNLFTSVENNLPKIDTFERNSSYIFRFLIVDPIRIRRYESRSIPHNLTSVLVEALTVAARGVP